MLSFLDNYKQKKKQPQTAFGKMNESNSKYKIYNKGGIVLSTVLLPRQIQLGTYTEGNVRKVKFNKQNPKHVRMFEKFYGVSV